MLMDEPIAENAGLLQTTWRWARSGWLALVDTITPPKCLTCHIDVATGATLCVACWQKLRTLDEPVCDVLGTPFEYDQGEGMVSAAAIAEPPPWDKARSAVEFNDTAKQLIHLLKYKDTQEAGITMAHMMTSAGRHLIGQSDIILPVPLHATRLWQRRFNQSAYLADRIAQQSVKPCRMDVLLRHKRTRQQVGLSAEERRKNVRRAFDIPLEQRKHIEGKYVLLVDDVRTTGATLSACTDALKDGGAARVHVLTFALVLEPLRPHIEA